MFSDRNIKKLDAIQSQIERIYTHEIPMDFEEKFKYDLSLFNLHIDLMNEQHEKEMREITLLNSLSHFFQAVLIAKENFQESNLDLIIDLGVELQKRIRTSEKGYWEELLLKMKKGEDFEKILLSFYMPPLASVFQPELKQENIFVDFKQKLLDFWANLQDKENRLEFLGQVPEIYKLNKLVQLICDELSINQNIIQLNKSKKMNVVDKVKMYEQNKAQKIESNTSNSNYLQQFKKEKQGLLANQKKQFYAFKKKFSLLKEPVILNVMKKHEFNLNIIEPELKMMQQNQQFSQSQNWIGDQHKKSQQNQNKNQHNNLSKNQHKKNFNQKNFNKNNSNNNHNSNQHQQIKNGDYNHQQTKNFHNKNQYKNFNGKNYQNKQYNYKKDHYQNQKPYKQQNQQYTQNKYHNNYSKYNNKYNNKFQNQQKNGYHKKQQYTYVKQIQEEKSEPIQNGYQKVKEKKMDQFERIPEQIEESNTYSEDDNSSEISGSKKIHQVIRKLDFILTDKMKQTYRHLQEFSRALETGQSQGKKNFEKKKYIKKGVDLKKEFIIEPDESSSHFVHHKVNVILQNKRFESEEEKFKSLREKQLETQIGQLKEVIDNMQSQIDMLKNQVEELQKQNTKQKQEKKETYCMVPLKLIEKSIVFKEQNKKFSLFGLSREDEEDEEDDDDDVN